MVVVVLVVAESVPTGGGWLFTDNDDVERRFLLLVVVVVVCGGEDDEEEKWLWEWRCWSGGDVEEEKGEEEEEERTNKEGEEKRPVDKSRYLLLTASTNERFFRCIISFDFKLVIFILPLVINDDDGCCFCFCIINLTFRLLSIPFDDDISLAGIT